MERREMRGDEVEWCEKGKLVENKDAGTYVVCHTALNNDVTIPLIVTAHLAVLE